MALSQFDPPGFLDDLTAPQKKRWSDWLSNEVDKRVKGRQQFFNELRKPASSDDQALHDISWTAFPRQIKISSPSDAIRWRRADAGRDVQDEYCEWSVERNSDGKITRVMFTSEPPEYWAALAVLNRSQIAALYQQHVNPAIREADLFSANGDYRWRNKWNTSTSEGAMHLVQQANTLLAEVQLASDATIPRARNGKILTDERELIECALYGAIERFSDPAIGGEVNALARQGAEITLANPIGLYIAGLSVTGWKTPDNTDPHSYWKVVRGTPDKCVRAEYSVPKEAGFTVSDVTINGKPITFGSQIADFITIKLTGLATRFGSVNQTPESCVGAGAGVDLTSVILSSEAPVDLAAAIARQNIPTHRE
jgi:hypothetical protein